jgi:hypothetical protein
MEETYIFGHQKKATTLSSESQSSMAFSNLNFGLIIVILTVDTIFID